MPQVGEIKLGVDIGWKAKYKVIWLICPKCGTGRWVRLQDTQGSSFTGLCKECFWQETKGQNHPAWKGGKYKDNRGYIRIYAPEHPERGKNKYVFEHILVQEHTHNKLLPPDYTIHHLNGIKNDNRPRNLVALPKGRNHNQLVFQALKQKIRELETEVKLLEKALDTQQMIFRLEEN